MKYNYGHLDILTSKFSSYLLSFQEGFLFKSEILWSRYVYVSLLGGYINLQYTVYKYALCQNCLKSSGYFKCTCASMQKGPQRDLLTTKSLLPSQRNLEIKKHGMGISHKSISFSMRVLCSLSSSTF